MPAPRIGTEFAGYRIDALLGRGGMGVVYRAENARLGTKIALKLLAEELAEDESFRERFVRESRTAASINHPSIVPIYDAGDRDGVLYIAMRYVEGLDLKALLAAEGPLEPERALALAGQVAGALDAAHARGLIHRDVKPANVLVEQTADPEAPELAYLTDFGLTKHTESRSGLTESGQFMGTIDYISPEQIQGQKVNGRADVYSLGCVLFECLTGEVPFRRETDVATVWAHMGDAPPAASVLRPGLGASVDGVLEQALAKDPAERFETCRELVDALRAEIGRSPRRRPRRARRRARVRARARRIASLAAALLLAAAAAALGTWLATRNGKTAAPTAAAPVFTAADRVLLAYVPAAIRPSCLHGPAIDPDFSAAVACRGGAGAVQYNLARSGLLMREHFVTRALAAGFQAEGLRVIASGRCSRDARAVRDWTSSGPRGHQELLPGAAGTAEGRVLCYQRNGWAAIEWTDSRNDVYTIAFGNEPRRLYAWWRSAAGPAPSV
jgi:hypothetical protein